jgi:hypothetical protein
MNSKHEQKDPLQVSSFLELYNLMAGKAIPIVRKIAFTNMLKYEAYSREGDVLFMKGAKCNSTEKQTAAKLTGAGFYVVFPSKGQLKAIRQLENATDTKVNDVYVYDKKTYYQAKADLKTVNSGSADTIAKHIANGSKQAPTIVLDVQGGTNRWMLIAGIRNGWSSGTKRILLSWKGQWYRIEKKHIFGDYLKITIK